MSVSKNVELCGRFVWVSFGGRFVVIVVLSEKMCFVLRLWGGFG